MVVASCVAALPTHGARYHRCRVATLQRCSVSTQRCIFAALPRNHFLSYWQSFTKPLHMPRCCVATLRRCCTLSQRCIVAALLRCIVVVFYRNVASLELCGVAALLRMPPTLHRCRVAALRRCGSFWQRCIDASFARCFAAGMSRPSVRAVGCRPLSVRAVQGCWKKG